MKVNKRLAGSIALVFILAVLALLLYRGPLGPVKVTAAAVHSGRLEPQIFGVGTVEARYLYTLGATQTGRLSAVHVDNGDRVSAKQILAEIDPIDLDERNRSAAASYERSQYFSSIAKSQLDEATSKNALAQSKLKRYRELYRQQAISKSLMEEIENEAAVAQSSEEAARYNLTASGRDVERYEADHAALVRQRANLQIVSPVDGVVLSREAEPGSTIVAGQAVLKVADPKNIWVRARIDQARASGITAGQMGRVVLRSRQGETFPVKVARIDFVSDTVAEERIVYVQFVAVPAGIAIGELAEVTINLPPLDSTLYIPGAALKNDGGKTGVWKAVDGKATFAAVTIGAWTLDGKVQILSGLAEGDKVIVHSPTQLREGLSVRAGDEQ